MARKENQAITDQINFLGKEPDSFCLPIFIDEVREGGQQVMDILNKRRLWEKRPSGQCLLVNFNQKETEFFDLNPATGQIKKLNSLSKDYSGLLFLINSSDLEIKPFLTEEVDSLTQLIKPQGPVYIFEKLAQGIKSNDLDLDQRKSLTAEFGLVEKNFLKQILPDWLIWEGRIKKERKARDPVDLTNKNSKYYEKTRAMWKAMVKEYKQTGFKIVSAPGSELLERLKNSRSPYTDLRLIKYGFGVEIKGVNCDCHYQIALNGTIIPIKECGKEHVFNRPLKKPEKQYRRGESEYGINCGDCAAPIIENVYVIKERGKKVEIGIETICPHCGLLNSEKKIIPKRNLIGL